MAHYLNTHPHSWLYPHNLLHHSHLTQTTHPHTPNPKEHHNHLPLHNLNSSLLLGQILIRPPSLPFQLQRHTNLCPAHHHIPKSVNGEGVKNSKTATRANTTDGQLCFQCKQPGHLKKDCPEQPYCSRCRTRGHVPIRCPSKQQDNRPTQEENSQSQRTHREECKRSQDQPQLSHINNRCLHCAGDHQSHDCPARQQHQASTTSNSASGPGIYQNINKFANTSHISQQSQSTVGITTPTLPVTNPPLPHNFQHPPPINPQLNYQA